MTPADGADDGDQRLRRQQAAIVALARSPAGARGDLDGALEEITAAAARTVGVERTSIWLLSPDRQDLFCLKQHNVSTGTYTDGATLRAAEYPRYFAALETGRAIDAHDARTDARTDEFREHYLTPLGITAMLDAPVRRDGRIIGAVCHEHVGGARIWTVDEVEFAGAVADQVALALAAVERRRHEQERARMQEVILHTQKLEGLGLLASGIAHDFNNILGIIVGSAAYAKMLLPEDHRAREALDDVTAAADRAAQMVRQLLAYSGRHPVLFKAIDLNQHVHDIVRLVSATTSPRLHLVCTLAEDLPPIDADASQVQQVVMNLLINASEALGPAGGDVRVGTALVHLGRRDLDAKRGADELRPGPYVELTVADDGCGMANEAIEKVFDPFFTTKGPGRGLGLAAVLGIIRGHRGALGVVSTPGRGTTFQAYLPARQAAAVGVAPSPAAAPAGLGTILVIDDEPAVRTTVGRMLEHWGYGALLAGSGRGGIETFRRDRDDITAVIIDVTMPDMSGPEVFEALRRESPDLPVIFTSGYDRQDATREIVDQGLAGFLAKPHTPEQLADEIRIVTGRRRPP